MSPGKFSFPLDEAMYGISLDGGPDDEAGSSTEAPGTWAGLMRDGDELADRIESDRKEFPNITDKDLKFLRSDGSAGVILTERSDGFVEATYYASKSDLDKDWKEVQETLTLDDEDDLEPNRARSRRGRGQSRGRGRHRPNTSIADRRKAGIIEGLTKAEMDSMEIRIPTFEWTQVDGDMDPGKYGGTIARANGDSIELIEIQPVRELVGDGEAKDVGFPFWSKEGYYDLDSLSLRDPDVQSAIETSGLGESLLGMSPEDRAVAIATACLHSGVGSEEGPGGWAKDVLGSRKVDWNGSMDSQGYEFIADEDDEFRREILHQYEVVVGGETSQESEWFDDEDEAIEAAKRKDASNANVQVLDSELEVVWDSDDDGEGGALESNSSRRFRKVARGRHTQNPRRYPVLMSGNDPMSQLLDMQAESLDPSGRGIVPSEVKGELSYTDDLIRVVTEYEDALRSALEEVVEKYPPADEASADELFDDEAPYLVLMTLMGHGVGIWDGSWREHYDGDKEIAPVQELLEKKLGRYADSSGSGAIVEAMDEAVYEAMRRAEYGFTDDGYAPLSEGGVLDVEFADTELLPERVEEIVRANDISTPKFWDKVGARKPITRGEVDRIVRELGGRYARNSARKRFDVFLNGELLDPVYMPPNMSTDDVKRVLVREGYDSRIRVDQPPERRTNLPPHYRSATLRENRSWSRAYMNDLPDSAFLYIEPGGREDEAGRTVPRSLRHFPYKDQKGHIDLPHLRNALSRIPQSNVPTAAKRAAVKHAEKLLQEHGGYQPNASPEEDMRVLRAIRETASGIGRAQIADVRDRLGDISKGDLDKLLLDMQRRRMIVLYRNDNTAEVTERDRRSAVMVGDAPRHLVYELKGI